MTSTKKKHNSCAGADLGGKGDDDAFSPQGFDPPADPKSPPFVLFWDIHFWLTDPKIFLKAPLATIYTHYKRAEKTGFFGKHFPKKKAQKRHFWPIFPKTFSALSSLGVLGKSFWSD